MFQVHLSLLVLQTAVDSRTQYSPVSVHAAAGSVDSLTKVSMALPLTATCCAGVDHALTV